MIEQVLNLGKTKRKQMNTYISLKRTKCTHTKLDNTNLDQSKRSRKCIDKMSSLYHVGNKD